ncbi:autotransporter-associated beta strand repeat-containing protein [Sphingomonas sp. KC8]|nr:autotransporter-associated beta strand repeat-containing protein [Sphingomonas sp. KC8]ARS26810.1 outer membrane autotransporter [Sphingomonas sp. KC8]
MNNNVERIVHKRRTNPLSRGLLCGASVAAVLALGVPSAAWAGDRHWDANGTGVSSGGTGTWNLTNLNWSPNGDGVSGPYNNPWINAALDNAIFGGTAGTVTIAAPVTVHDLTFNTHGYILSGSTLTLGGAAPVIGGAGNATINSIIAGSSGLTKTGGGALALNGINSFTGDINLNAGSLYAGSDAALGAAGNNILTAAGATVRLSIAGAATGRTVTIGNGGNLILEGTGSGSARITGNGSVQLAASGITMSNDLSDYTGRTVFQACNGTCSTRFTSIGNLGQASSLGAPVTVADGTIIFNQQSQYSDSIIYLGDGDSSNRNWDINGNGAIIRNQGTGTLEITGDVDISVNGSFSAETADFRLLGVLSGGAFGFNASAGRNITLGNANVFTGQANLAGEIRIGKLADIGSASSLGAGTTINLGNGALSYTGTGDASNREWLVNGGANAIRNDGTGALNLSGALAFNASNPNPDTLTLGGSYAGTNIFSGALSGNGNIVADSAGTWVLGGTNSQRGTITVANGTLRAGSAGAFGAKTGFIVNGGTLDLGGFDLVAPSLTGSGGTVALGGSTLTVAATTAQNFAGSIAGSGGLIKAGAGTLTLTGMNGYTGATTVTGGKLALDFAGAGGPAANIIAAGSHLVLSGGALEVLGAAGEANGQTFNGLTVSAGSNMLRAVNGAGGTVNLNLGAINRTGGLVNFVLPGAGTITTSNLDGVLGGWATINGSDYAKVVGGNIVAFDALDYTDKDDAGSWANGEIISDTAGAANSPFFGTVGGNVNLAGLRYSAAAGSTIIVGAGNTLGVDGTIIVAPSVGTANQTITGGQFTSGPAGGTLGVQHNGGGIFTIESAIVDGGGVTAFAKGGAGRVVLSGANSYSGATTLTDGILQVSSIANGGVASGIGASSAASSNLVLEGGTLQYTGGTTASDRGFTLVNGGPSRTIDVTAAGTDLVFSGVVTSPDDAGFAKTGEGTLTLANAANDYVGVTTVARGTLAVNTLTNGGFASGIGAADNTSANLVLTTGGRLRYTGGTVATDRGFTLANGLGRIDVEQAATTLTISGVATGTGTFIKDGAGTLILSGTNTYTGDTTVTAGILRAGSARAFGPGGRNMIVNAGATLDLGGFDIGVAVVIGAGLVDLGGRTLTTGGGSGVFTGRITGTGGYTRTGGATQTFIGCNNDYTGVTTISGGLAIDCIANGGQASSIGASSAAASSLVLAGGTLAYTGASASTDRGFTVAGNSTINILDAGATLEFSGTVAGGAALNKDGAGTLLLSGTNNSTGNVRVLDGTLRAGSTTALGSGWLSLDNTAGVLFDLDGYNNSVAALAGGGALGGNITLDGATLTINTGGSLVAANFGGVISGNGGLIKNGGSIQQLSGCANSYDGTTVINAGTLAVACLGDGGANSSIGSSSSAAGNLVLSGGTLQYVGAGGSTNRQFTLGASATSKLDASGTGAIAFTHAGPLTFASANTAQTLTLGGTSTANNIFAAQITNNGTGLTRLTKNDAGTWVLTNAGSTYTGITTINGGVLAVDKLANGGIASSIGASSAAAANLVIGNGSTLRYTGSGDMTNRLFTLSAGVTFIESSGTGAIVFTDTGPVTLTGSNQARTIALGGTNSGNNTLAGSIGNAGTGVTTLAKNDSGTWVLTGNHSYTGSTNINGGTLFIGNGATTGSVASTIVNNFGTLGFNRSDLLTYGGQIVGTGSLRQAGTGTTVLTGNSSYTGGTTIDAGTLQLGNGGTTGSIVGDVVDNGVLAFNRSDLVNFSGTISGTGAVQQIGSGTTVLSGINGYAGGTSILGGTLQVSADANLGAATGGLSFSGGTLRTTASFASARNSSLAGSGTILTDLGTTFALGGVMSGAGGLTKSGAGILTLSGNNSYAGATNVNAGTLRINGDQSAATGLVTVASGATLGGSGTIGGSVNVLNGGILAPGNSPGTLNINGGLSLASGSVLNFEFGEAGIVGGALNDLVNVGANLTLDGTINVTGSSGGYFGGGIYRVFNYGGTLIDNGLTLGSMPAGSNVIVQTSVAGQVNLVNSDGLALSFWDGGIGPKFDDLVNGGNGSWHLGGADNNWTGADGAINAAYADSTYAIFAGAPGTVMVDNSGGAVTATGMQFATDGYLINGAPLTLVGPESIIRVGDGTAPGAGYTARISANLTGATQLVKTDGGTLILAGLNDYTGGTRVEGGTLRISADGNLGAVAGGLSLNGGTLNTTTTMTSDRAVTLTGIGTLQTDAFTTLTLSGAIAGGGTLAKSGGGTLVLTGDAVHSGGTTIAAGGTLQLGNGGTTGSIVGDIVNDGVLTFNRSDNFGFAGAISGAGTLIKQAAGGVTLTGSSSYAGATSILGGSLLIQAGGHINGTSVVTVNGGGEMIVDGVGSRLAAGPGQSIIGQSGSSGATLIVRDGGAASFGQFDVANGVNTTGTVTVTGAGSQLSHSGSSYLGRFGTATLNVTDGGRMESNGPIVFVGGQATMSQGLVTVTGAGSNWAVADRFDARRGTITVADGGVITAGSSVIGFNSGVGINNPSADLIVTGAGSRFETIGGLAITNSSTNGDRGSITIGDGGVVRVGSGTLAMGPGNATLYIGDFQSLPVGKRAGVLDAAELTFAAASNAVNFNHIDSDYVFATRMSGAGEVYSSRGTTILTADNAYSGQTHINGGMIIFNGDQSAATGRVNVMAGGALGGRGVIGGSVDGFGRIAPGDLGAAPGTLTINDDLLTNFVTNLDYNFGQANVVGGAYNDLINVGGNLTLDGTLNVAVSPGGSFDPGVYRVINYAGTLTDNGLAVDPRYFVQTSVANQVNLVNTTGLTMRFWDGAAGAKNDGMITGGDGLWQASGGNDNWTEYDGSANAPFTDGAFAVFSGLPGTVTVDGSLGVVTAAGMQFASDGFVVDGDAIVLSGVQSVIRVGDGTAAGVGYTSTIYSAIAGASQLVKADLGTLVLSGVNSYAGGTAINRGTLRISADANLGDVAGGLSFDGGTLNTTADIASSRAVNLVGTGGFLTDAGTTLTMNGAFSGAGSLVKTGTGALVLRGSSGFAGDATVDGGRLSITDGGSVSNFRGYIGNAAGQTGEVVVSGPGSSWTNANHIYVGYSGTGLLTIENGATVSNANGIVGLNAGSAGTVTVSGAGSTWTSSDNLRVGVGGEGTLTVDAGAKVVNLLGSFGIGQDAGSDGSVIASGAGSTITARAMFVGNSGDGQLTIANGAEVLSDISRIGAVAGSQAVINIGAAAGQGPTAAGILNTPMLTFGDGDGALVFNHSDTGYLFSAGLDSQGAGTHTIQHLAGTTLLSGDGSAFAGTTTVSGGTLLVGDQSGAGSLGGAVNVALGGTLGGAGTIGGDVTIANGGALAAGVNGAGTLTINGGLSLAGGAALNFEFGAADVVGGALNDLVNVGGDLVLDGMLNVAVPTGGSFDVGVYRLINYGGSLTDNGLGLGAMPAGAQVFVQTAVSGQVNLVNQSGLTLNYWDGAGGPQFDGVINGGNGVWQSRSGNHNWTGADGAINAAFTDDAFAIFAGSAGTVVVDDGQGAVGASGMQFATNGYRVEGDAIVLAGQQAVIRVGDGTAAGSGITATIASELTGAAELVKTDAGTLVLTADNSHAGGTAINGGTLQIARDANLGAAAGAVAFDGGTLRTTADMASDRAVRFTGTGNLLVDGDTTFQLNGALSGAGTFTKSGAGILELAGNNAAYVGAARIENGRLRVNGVLGGTLEVLNGAALEGVGTIGTTTHRAGGIIAPGGSAIGTLTINGDYVGDGGRLEIDAALGGDGSSADRLVVTGATSGSTMVTVANRGGAGAQTVNGIKIVDVLGASNGRFHLQGDYLFEGDQAVVIGAYGYRLYKNGITDPADGDWYLRSALLDAGPGEPEPPLYQPGVPVYEGYTQTLQALNELPTLQQRVGNRSWADATIAGQGVWGRIDSARHRPEAAFSTTATDLDINSWKMQMGVDTALIERRDGATLVAGLTAHYGEAKGHASSFFGSGTIDTTGYGLGATLTWYGPRGFYIDGQAQLSWFDSDLKSGVLGRLADSNDGKGQAFGLELGKRSTVGVGLMLTPQIQVRYAHVGFDPFVDPVQADIASEKGASLATRWGLSIDHQASWDKSAGQRRSHIYGVVNLAYEWLDRTQTRVSATPIAHRDDRLAVELGLGGSYSWNDRITLYGEVSGNTSVADFGAGYTLKANAGVRMRF